MKRILSLGITLIICLVGRLNAQIESSNVAFNSIDKIKLQLPENFNQRLEYACSEKTIHKVTGQRIDSLSFLMMECRNLKKNWEIRSDYQNLANQAVQSFLQTSVMELFEQLRPGLQYSDVKFNMNSNIRMPVRDKAIFETGQLPSDGYIISVEDQILMLAEDDSLSQNLINLWNIAGKELYQMRFEIPKLLPEYPLRSDGKRICYKRKYCYDCSTINPIGEGKCESDDLELWRKMSTVSFYKQELMAYAEWVNQFNVLLNELYKGTCSIIKKQGQFTTEMCYFTLNNNDQLSAECHRLSKVNRKLFGKCTEKSGNNKIMNSTEGLYQIETGRILGKDKFEQTCYFNGVKQNRMRFSSGFFCEDKWIMKNCTQQDAQPFAMEALSDPIFILALGPKTKGLDQNVGAIKTYVSEIKQTLIITYEFSELLHSLDPNLKQKPVAEKYTLRGDTVYVKSYSKSNTVVSYLNDGDLGSPMNLFSTIEFYKGTDKELRVRTITNLQGQFEWHEKYRQLVWTFSNNNNFECMILYYQNQYFVNGKNLKKNLEDKVTDFNWTKYVAKQMEWDAKVKKCDYCKQDYTGIPYTYKRDEYGFCDGFNRYSGGCSPFFKGGNCCSPKCSKSLCEFDN